MTARSWQKWMVLVVALALIVPTASVAFAVVDEFGGESFTAAYAPYTAGPVVDEQPYAPYTAGPVVGESAAEPYAPYTAGPVVREEFAPFTVKESVPMNLTHWMIQ
jgi:hypothetical protein